MQNNFKAIIFTAPSGSGKTTLVHCVMKSIKNLEFSISATTRQKRINEKDGKDYYFLTVNEFKKKINNNEFIEWEEVYKGLFYGTLKSEIDKIWKKNKNVIFDVDVKGAMNLKKYFGKNALSIFVLAPSMEELEKRLKKRATDSEKKIKERIEKAKLEIKFKDKFDVVIVNKDINETCKKTLNIINKFLEN